MHARLAIAEFNGDISGLASFLLGTPNGQISDISRQTVGGEVAVSTIEDNGYLCARTDR